MIRFVHKEYDQIPARLRLAESSIHILAMSMPLFDKTEHDGRVLKDLPDFLAGNAVFGIDLLDHRIKPNNSPDPHARDSGEDGTACQCRRFLLSVFVYYPGESRS